jgi:hypothetical protein
MHEELVRVYALLRKDASVTDAVQRLKRFKIDGDDDENALKQIIFDACDNPEIRLQSFTGILSEKRKRRYSIEKKQASEQVDPGVEDLPDNNSVDEDEDCNDSDGYYDAKEGVVANVRESTMTPVDCTALKEYQKNVQVGECR